MNSWEYDHFEKAVQRIERLLLDIKKQGETQMAQIDDLNAAIQSEDVEINDILPVVTKIQADITTLLAKVAAGGTPTDLTTQIQAIQSHVSSLTTALQQLNDADTSANPAPPAS